jgi:hypothetical protein
MSIAQDMQAQMQARSMTESLGSKGKEPSPRRQQQ